MGESRFFKSQREFRKWLEKNHDKFSELILGFYNKQSGKEGILYKQAVDEALCFGWIDGVRRKLDDDSYTGRFSPRKAKSYWSSVNIKRFHELEKLKQIAKPGMDAFQRRDEKRAGMYSFENKPKEFEESFLKLFQASAKAWKHFQSEPPWYRRTTTFWVMSAKQEETRRRRLDILIKAAQKGERPGVIPPSKKDSKK